MRQPMAGLLATLLMLVLSLLFISLFDFPTLSGWVAYWTQCGIPMILVIAIAWHTEHPTWAARRPQPLKGLLLILLLMPAALLVGVAHFFWVGGQVGPPTPTLMMCIIASITVTFWAAIMWGGWPFNVLFRHPVASGLAMLVACYLVNIVLFRLFYNFEFLQGAPVYVPAIDPHGLFNAWHALTFYVSALAVMFLMLNFEVWPLSKSPRLMRQPTLGVVWTAVALLLGGAIYYLGVHVLGVDTVVFLARVPVAFIFGTIVVLNMFQNSLFARVQQPARGVLNSITAIVIGGVLSAAYLAIAPYVTGALRSGSPGYELEIWVASALLAVTFPFLALYADFFGLWPLRKSPREDGPGA